MIPVKRKHCTNRLANNQTNIITRDPAQMNNIVYAIVFKCQYLYKKMEIILFPGHSLVNRIK